MTDAVRLFSGQGDVIVALLFLDSGGTVSDAADCLLNLCVLVLICACTILLSATCTKLAGLPLRANATLQVFGVAMKIADCLGVSQKHR